jgi:hypothetical protein
MVRESMKVGNDIDICSTFSLSTLNRRHIPVYLIQLTAILGIKCGNKSLLGALNLSALLLIS